MAEPPVPVFGYPLIGPVSDEGRHDEEGFCEAPSASQGGDGSQSRGRSYVAAGLIHESDRPLFGWAGRLTELSLGSAALQSGESEFVMFVELDEPLDKPVAKAAFSVKEDYRLARIGLVQVGTSTYYYRNRGGFVLIVFDCGGWLILSQAPRASCARSNILSPSKGLSMARGDP